MFVVINNCFGGFGFSEEFKEAYPGFDEWDVKRNNRALTQAIIAFGPEDASGDYSELEIAVVPDGATDWRIEGYDGLETVWYVLDGKMHIAGLYGEEE